MRYFISSLILAILLFLPPSTMAQDELIPEATIQSLTFDELNNFVDETIRGPYDSMRYRFSLPNNWQLQNSIEASLQLSMVSTSPQNAANLLQIYFNNVFIQTFSLESSGNQTLRFTIPAIALTSYLGDNRHELYVIFDARQECESGNHSLVVINRGSNLSFNYTETELEFNLRKLPNPIYQDSFEVQTALIVIPNNPSEQNMRAALITAAAFGRMSSERLPLSLVREQELTETIKAENHLLYIGLADSFAEAATWELPLVVRDNQFDPELVPADVGVLELIANPLNPQRALLFVSGSNEAGLVKAAQALSYGQVMSYNQDNLALIESTNFLQSSPDPAPQVISLADAGYENIAVDRPTSTHYFVLHIPYADKVEDGAVFNLAIDHSRLIDFTGSGIRIRLNGAPIGSIELTDSTADFSYHPISLPANALIAGINEIALDVDLRPRSGCFDEINRQLWLNIYNVSNLSLPLSSEANTVTPLTTLKTFPAPFEYAPNLETTRFVLEANAPETWNAAAQLAVFMGNRALSDGIAFELSFDNQISEENLGAQNLIIIGNPASHLVAQALDAKLAELANPDAEQGDAMPINYRIAPDSQYAYLQFMISPWNESYAILTVFSPQASTLLDGVNLLAIPETRFNLRGNFAIVQGEDIFVNTVEFTSTMSQNLGTEVEDTVSQSLVLDNTSRITIFVIVGIGIVVVVLVVIGLMRLFQNRASQQ